VDQGVREKFLRARLSPWPFPGGSQILRHVARLRAGYKWRARVQIQQQLGRFASIRSFRSQIRGDHIRWISRRPPLLICRQMIGSWLTMVTHPDCCTVCGPSCSRLIFQELIQTQPKRGRRFWDAPTGAGSHCCLWSSKYVGSSSWISACAVVLKLCSRANAFLLFHDPKPRPQGHSQGCRFVQEVCRKCGRGRKSLVAFILRSDPQSGVNKVTCCQEPHGANRHDGLGSPDPIVHQCRCVTVIVAVF